MSDMFREGMLVLHPAFGLGKILLIGNNSAWIYFKDVEGTPKDAVKKLALSVAKLAVAENQTDSVLDNLPPMVHKGVVAPPNRIRLTERQAVDLFVAGYKSFEDESYLQRERDYKWKAHEAVTSRWLTEPARRLTKSDPTNALPKLLRDLLSATNLLATQELIRLNEAFKEAGAAQQYGRAVLAFADESSADSFEALVEAVDSLPAKEGSRTLTWPTVTLLPFLAYPTRHMFLKPQVTQRIADVFMFDLLYDARPTWATYLRLLRLSEVLLNRLRPLGARDFIDVQSFMWIVEGQAYMRGRAQKP